MWKWGGVKNEQIKWLHCERNTGRRAQVSSVISPPLKVNGRKTSLPSTLADQLTVRVSNRMVVIERSSSVRVTYSISQEVIVAVGNHLAGKVCGACGNYNGNSKDDLKTADGAPSTDVSVIVGSWRAGDFSNW